MDARACTPKRVKDILSSFLHDVITEDVSQQSSSLEALEQAGDGGTAHKGSQPTTRGCRATDRAAFFSRVQTYSPLTWFAKPAWLSALACAQYGWVNVDVDLLRCVGCNKHLSGRMPSSFEPQVYAECCKKLVDSLKMAHSKFCCWVSYPSPDSFLRLPLSSRTTAETEFVSLLKAFLRLQAELPRIETVQIESMGLTRDTLLSLRRYAGVTWQSCHDGSYDLDDTFCSACMLAVCGWASSSSSGVAQLRCRYCNRSAGLWNYHTYTSPSQPDDVINESHDSSNSLPPGGTTCDSPPKSSSALVTPMGDADERHSTGSDSHVEDVSGKGSSSPGCEVEVRLEVGEESVGLMGESRQQDAESSDGTGSESTSKNTSDTETKSRVNDENGMQNGLVEEHLVRNESVVSTESKSLPESSGEANREENIGQTEINEEECCVLNESDKEKCCVPSESDKEECCVPSESDKEECCVPSESNNEEHVEQTENDKEEHVEETETSKLDMLSEVDAVDGRSVQEVKCFERSAEENGVAPSHQPNLDNYTEPGDVKSDNLKTEDDLGSTREVQFAGEDESPNVRDDTDVTGGTLTETATGETHKSGGCGEPDELMDVDISETSEDMSRKRTMSDGGERNCSTGQQSLDNGHNDVTSHRQEDVESTAKRRKLRKPSRVTFDPIAEHHSWCPWVLPDTHPDRGSEATPTVGDRETLPGWRRFLEVLTPVGSHESHSLISIVKTSPPCVGLRSIRKLFLGWTRSATPDC